MSVLGGSKLTLHRLKVGCLIDGPVKSMNDISMPLTWLAKLLFILTNLVHRQLKDIFEYTIQSDISYNEKSKSLFLVVDSF